MEDILMIRLVSFTNDIESLANSANQLCSCRPWDSDQLEQGTIVSSKLKSLLDRFNVDLYQYFNMAKDPNVDDVSSLTVSQLEGEQALAELNARIQYHQNSKLQGINSTLNRSKLPELKLQIFHGDILTWHSFWDQFQSNVGQRNITNVDKLLYLKASLGGEAKNIIDGLETTNNNYDIAIEILKIRYGNTEQIIDAHYSQLYKIKPALKFEDCRKTIDEIEKHLRILQSLGEGINHNNLRFIIMEKFPEDIIYEVRIKAGTESLEQMRKQLNIIISAKEAARGLNKIKTEEIRQTTEMLHIREKWRRKNLNKSQFRLNRSERLLPRNRSIVSAFTRSVPANSSFIRPYASKRPYEFMRNERNDLVDQSSNQKRKRYSCIFCHGHHFNDKCMVIQTPDERRRKLVDRCYCCFHKGHMAKACPVNVHCVYCGRNRAHNRALCPKLFFNQTKFKSVNTLHVHGGKTTALQTAVVNVKGKEGINRKCRLIFDSGSQKSYVNKKTAEELDLKVEEENHLFVFTFGAKKPREIESDLVKLCIQTRNDEVKTLYANVVPTITQGISCPGQDIRQWTSDNQYTLADDGSQSDRIDILIGNDYYHSFMSTKKIKLKEDLYLVDSEFGFVLSGRIDDTNASSEDKMTVLTYFQSCHESKLTNPDPPLDNGDIKSLWSLESIGITDSLNISRDDEVVKFFNETTTFDDNRYVVSWPWNEYPPNLPSNFGIAYGRLVGLLKRSDQKTLNEYNQLGKGIIEPVPNSDKVDHPVHYLAHHGVSSPGKSTRIVYDASAKTKDNKSLNECLYCGPRMLEDLIGLLIKFRCHKIAVVADVEKAFLQMGLHEKDRDVTRFLWIKDINKPVSEDNLVHYRFTRVPFGVVSSPYLLNATIKHHLGGCDSENVRKIANDIYVDNLLTGTDNLQEAVDLYKDCKRIFNQISMNMREWSSNSKELIKQIPDASKIEVVKTLGLNWNLHEDTLRLRTKTTNNAYTKRGVLKTTASIFDPCGFAAPIILPAKIFLQSLWQDKKLNWDTPLPAELIKQWNDLLKDLEMVKEVCLPRNITKHRDCEIHCFTDASAKAYAAVVYLVQENNVKFIMGKSRLAPIRGKEELKIPRLELLGVLIGSRLIQFVTKYVQANVKKQTLWSDSQIVISWCNSNKLLVPFVSRRIEEIKRNKTLEIRYIPSECNPADIGTKPIKTKAELKRWLEGPTFLLGKSSTWPTAPVQYNTSLLAGEGLSNNIMSETESRPEDEHEVLIQMDDISSEDKGKTNDERELSSSTVPIDIDMGKSSEVREIINIQKHFFPDEVNGKKTHLYQNLKLFVDVDGVIRSEGRLTHSDLSYEAKHPILLPKDCDFTNNIIRKVHEENYHVGVPHTLSLVRQRFWIPQGRAQVQKVISKCPQCVKYGGGPYTLPDTPALPPERVRYESPFTYVGIDYFGPMFVKSDSSQEKIWICLFTCLVIRAIHLEIVKDMSTEECSLALRRFIAVRGTPLFVVSDNALQFKLLSEVITGLKIRWKFIPQLAPWHGGAYERLVAVVKHCLKRTLQKHLLGSNQLLTIMKEVEAVVNTRPLTYVGSGSEHVFKTR